MNFELFDPRSVVLKVLDLVRFQAEERNVQLLIDFDSLPPELEILLFFFFILVFFSYQVCTDIKRFEQILMNLLTNSTKYTFSGEIVLTLSTNDDLNEKSYMACKIEDTGIGIHPDNIGKLFQLFGLLEHQHEKEQTGNCFSLFILFELRMWNGFNNLQTFVFGVRW